MKVEFLQQSFRKLLKYKISGKSPQWKSDCSMQTGGQTRRNSQSLFAILRTRLQAPKPLTEQLVPWPIFEQETFRIQVSSILNLSLNDALSWYIVLVDRRINENETLVKWYWPDRGRPTYSQNDFSQYHFVHNKSDMYRLVLHLTLRQYRLMTNHKNLLS